MAEYIDRSAFLEKERRVYCETCKRRENSKGKVVYEIGEAPCRACGIGDVLDDLEDVPAADVVEVVRCKDCINHRKSGLCDGWSRYGTITTPDDAYCSYGRKIDGN